MNNNSPPNVCAGTVVHADKLVDWLTVGVKRRLIVLVGLPASGKSTLSDRLQAKGVTYLNRDSIREKLYGDASKLGDYREVSAVLYKQLEEGCDKDAIIVAD
ncbi:MAG: ATP-binding protein, partial [Cyanobacteria bacterium]|nr:ATP-binding protein [Cyanobacteriota bacterium]